MFQAAPRQTLRGRIPRCLLHPVRLLDGLTGEYSAHGGVHLALRQGGSEGSVTHAGLLLSHGLSRAQGSEHRRYARCEGGGLRGS